MTRSGKHWSRKIKRRDKKRAERLAAALEVANSIVVNDASKVGPLFSSTSDVLLPRSPAGATVSVFNQGGKPIKVHDANNQGIELPPGKMGHFLFTGKEWRRVL